MSHSKIPVGGGPRVAALGGGTGLSTMLRGLKYYTDNLTAIVTVADDGGGSGMLRQDLGMPPPGDIRSCLQAMANAEPIMEDLLDYRFKEGSLAGQSFGNLFLAALNGISPSFDQAVARMSEVLAINGQVLPVTNENVNVVAEFENGTSVMGESKISAFKRAQNCRITRVYMRPERPAPLDAALEAIRRADIILLGPGSLYTSVIPNLLVDGVAEAIASSHALRIYIANIMTQEGETEGYTLSDHLKALFAHAQEGLVDLCLANSTELPTQVVERYRTEKAEPIQIDWEEIERLGVQLTCRPLADENGGGRARHDPVKLARAIMDLIEAHCVRTWTDCGIRYIREK
ncbi:MAG: hypothetical protein DBY10_00710 [Clostridiales bacterium]|jgi:uncharacterized cofD-like protein|uniref:gluconeogenesis factor YvcK family protein n=1 Tax=Dysosmobacter welbionis TaxID=2093857 RepID=UPI000D7B92C6|nr:MAG: hypothetical protein DBY10_04570 [Clostridiales bacterium]PWL92583.1 MAG: hypothetical protein DBY10_00710 [Clostridiales bacterium]